MCKIGRFHYSQVHAFGCEIIADGVSKEQINTWGYLEVKAFLVFETMVGENELETRLKVIKAKNLRIVVYSQ